MRFAVEYEGKGGSIGLIIFSAKDMNATLYRSIKHLLEDGLIEESDVRPDPALDDERRHYYRLTEFGCQVALAEVRRLEEALAVARSRRGLRGLLPAPPIEEAR